MGWCCHDRDTVLGPCVLTGGHTDATVHFRWSDPLGNSTACENSDIRFPRLVRIGRVGAQMQRRRAFPSKFSAGLPASGLFGTIPHAKCGVDQLIRAIRVVLSINADNVCGSSIFGWGILWADRFNGRTVSTGGPIISPGGLIICRADRPLGRTDLDRSLPVETVALPFFWIVTDVIHDALVFRVMTDDAIPIIVLP